MNEVIIALQKKLNNMRANLPSEAASVEQINKYFLEQQEITEQMLKILDDQENASTSEILGCKEAIKNFREAMKQADSKMEQLSLRDVYYNLGKALCAAWNKDQETLGQLKFCPNIRAEKWNNPKDFTWETGKGFVPSKAVLGDPIGNLANKRPVPYQSYLRRDHHAGSCKAVYDDESCNPPPYEWTFNLYS